MSIESIGTVLQSIPTAARNAADTVGSSAFNKAGQAKDFIKSKFPNLKTSPSVDTFVSQAKEKTPDVIKNNKNTIVGTALILAAVGCAATLIKYIASKIKQAKTGTRIGMHQG